jgi:hypothetical protein
MRTRPVIWAADTAHDPEAMLTSRPVLGWDEHPLGSVYHSCADNASTILESSKKSLSES